MKVHLDSVGCRLNQSELERIARQFQRLGYSIAASPKDSDLVVINTCTVTAAAAADSRAKARNAHRVNPDAKVILTGCWSSMEPEAAAALPGVAAVIPNSAKENLVAEMTAEAHRDDTSKVVAREPLPGNRRRTRAFVKVQDGCDNRCAFCITTRARGKARSEPPDRILEDIRRAVRAGVKEAVLSGVQLSAYGKDLGAGIDLRALVKLILDSTDIARLRLSSLEPWNVPVDLFSLWEDTRMCRQLHLPLQSGSERTLRRMGRPISPQGYARLLDEARKAIPGLAVTTDVIVGYPGEREQDFDESLQFITSMAFSEVHLFTYSPRPGTAAARLPDRVPAPVARDRASKIRTIADASGRAFMSQFVDHVMPVLWIRSERTNAKKWALSGLTDNFIRIHAESDQDLWNQLTPVRLISLGAQGVMRAQPSE